MLSDGFNMVSCLFELIDDSLGAAARDIRVTIDTQGKLIGVADDGHGMDREGLQNGHVLHNRGKPSKTKHGRFGIGRGHALAYFTQLKGKMTAMSRHTDCPEAPATTDESNKYQGIHMLAIDYPNVMATGTMLLQANELGFGTLPQWKKYAVNPLKKGTVTLMESTKEIVDEFVGAFKTADIYKNLQYRLASTYYNFILGGGKISVTIDGSTTPTYPMDPLLYSKIAATNKRTGVITVFQNKETKEIRAYFIHKGKTTHREFPDVGKAKLVHEDVPQGWEKVGVVHVLNAYSKAWVPEYKTTLESMGIKVLPKAEASSDFPQEDFLGGKYIERNGKIIARIETLEPTSGDFSKRRDTVKSHSLVRFNATDNETDPDTTRTSLDDVFKVMVNKSKLDKSDFQVHVWKTIEWMCAEFAKDMGNNHAPPPPPPPRSSSPPPAAPAPARPPPPRPPTPPPQTHTQGCACATCNTRIIPVPIPPPPALDITFSKTAEFVIISEKNKEIHRIRYAGHYHVQEQALRQNMLALGPARFKEYAKGLQALNTMFNA